MYININKILSEFSEFTSHYKISFYSEIASFQFSTKILDYYSPYCLYIFRAQKLPTEILSSNKVNDRINFLIIGEPENYPYLQSSNYIILKENTISIFDIVKKVQSLLNIDDALSSFKEEIFDSTEGDLSIQNMISIAYKYLSNPIMVLNSKYETCYFHLGNTVLNEPVWEFQLEHNRPHPDYSLKYNYNKKNRSMGNHGYKHIVTYFEDIMNHREIAVAVKHTDFVIGRICVLEVNRTINSSDLHILNTLAKMIYPLMISNKKFINLETSELDSILCKLITSKYPNMLLIQKQLSNFKFDLHSNIYLLCLSDLDNINSKSKMHYLKQMIQNILKNHYVFIFEHSILVLYNNKKSFEPFNKCPEYNQFISFVKNYTLSVGVSKLFNGFINIKNAYFESLSAINFGIRLKTMNEGEAFINFYDDYVLHDLIYDFVAKKKLHYILDSKTLTLIKENNYDLIKTIKYYIDYNGNLSLLSKELDIHYNTLKYRIDKLRDKYLIDLKDSDALIKLKLALVVLEISQGYNLKLEFN